MEAFHVLGHVGKDVGPHEHTFGRVADEIVRPVGLGDGAVAPKLSCAASLGHLDAGEEVVGVFFGEHWSVKDVVVNQRVANSSLLHLGHELAHEFVVDVLVQNEVAQARAALSGRAKRSPVSTSNGVVDVSGWHDHKRIFATQFQRAGHEVAAAHFADHFPNTR